MNRLRSLPPLVWASSMLSLAACGDDTPSIPRDAAVAPGHDASIDASAPSLSRDAEPTIGPDATSQSPIDAGSQGRRPVVLRFKAKVGSQDLVCGQTYEMQGSTKVAFTPQDFRLFVQEVRLIDAAGREVSVALDERAPFQTKDVALLDFTTGDGACSSGGPTVNTTLTGTVPAGTYTGLVFVNGVSESLNHADPTMAPAPLQAPGSNWSWTTGYRFLMAEVLQAGPAQSATAGVDGGTDAGAMSAATDGGAPIPGMGLVHLGSTGCTGTQATSISCSKANRSVVRLAGFDPTQRTIIADLGAIFSSTDLSMDLQCHGSGPACMPMFEALGVNLSNGEPQATQRVYRVE